MAQQFVQTKITGGKVVVFLKPSCPYCVMAQRVFSEYKFKPGHLECVDISGHSDMAKIQDYLMELTGARTVKAASRVSNVQNAGAFASLDASWVVDYCYKREIQNARALTSCATGLRRQPGSGRFSFIRW